MQRPGNIENVRLMRCSLAQMFQPHPFQGPVSLAGRAGNPEQYPPKQSIETRKVVTCSPEIRLAWRCRTSGKRLRKQTSLLNNSEKRGSGITVFSLTNRLSSLKQTICSNLRLGTTYARNSADITFDKRIIEGFRVSFRKLGRTGTCRDRQLWPTTSLKITCKASPDMIRLDKVPINLYRRDPSGRNTKVCKAPFSIREHGTNTQETRRAWLAQITK